MNEKYKDVLAKRIQEFINVGKKLPIQQRVERLEGELVVANETIGVLTSVIEKLITANQENKDILAALLELVKSAADENGPQSTFN